MQDNYEHEFDEQFVNQAWGQMARLLDREMPVEGAKRPFFLWWWLLGALALALAGWGVYAFIHSAAKPERAIASSPAVKLEKPASGASSGQTHPAPAEAAAGETGMPAPAMANGARGPISAKKQAISAGNKENAGIGEKQFYQQAPGKESEIIPASETISNPAEPVIIQNRETAIHALPLPPALNRAAQMLTWEPARPKLPVPIARAPGRIRLAAEGGLFAKNLPGPGGYLAGLSAELRPRNGRLYMRSGLHYRYYEQQAVISQQLLSAQNSRAQGNPSPAPGLLAASSELEQSRHLSLPLALGFRALPRLALEAGLQGSLLIGSSRSDSWNLTGGNSLPDGGYAGSSLLHTPRAGSANAELRALTLEALAGLAYYPTHKLALRLQYQYGMSDLLLSPSRKARQSGAQLSLAYYLLQ